MRILVVCTGNICRSPMAEALLRAELGARECDGVRVGSSGTWAEDGSPASSGAQSVMGDRGIDISGHRSRALRPAEVTAADLVVVMTSVHLQEILEVDADAAGKIFLMKEFPELRVARAESPLQAILDAERPGPRRSLDVDDPIGLPFMAYERCVRDLEAGVHALVELLCGGENIGHAGDGP